MSKPKHKDKLPAPEAFHRDIERLQTLARRCRSLSDELSQVYSEAFDVGLSANGSGSLAIARNRFEASDPTGETIVAKRQYEIRGACRRSVRDTERAIDSLEQLENSTVSLTSVFLQVDSRDLRRRRA